jgi:DNA-binding beta-propeller fold protein YncE
MTSRNGTGSGLPFAARGARLIVLAALAAIAASPHASRAAETRAFVLTSDYSTGSLSVMELSTRAVSKDVESVFSDASIRTYGGLIYVVNRFGQDNIQVIDPGAGYTTLRQFSTGSGTNPQDIAFVSPTQAYVSLYERSYIQECNPATGALLDTISLASFADGDHLPEMAKMTMVGNLLFVAIQRLDRLNGYAPSGPGLVAVVNTLTNTLIDVDPVAPGIQAIALTTGNPVTDLIPVSGTNQLWIGCAGEFGSNDGAIEAIDTATLHDVGVISTEAQLGGDIGDVAWYSNTHSYAIVSDASYNSSLVSFNPATGLKIGTVRSPGGFSLPDCTLDDRGELLVTDNGISTAGLYVYQAGSDALLAGPLNCGLPPAAIAFDGASAVAGVAPPGAAVASALLALDPPAPNPARASVSLAVHLASAGALEVSVFDLSGRRVATLARGDRPAGDVALGWALTDEDGRRVPAGVYLIRAEAGGQYVTRRVAAMK